MKRLVMIILLGSPVMAEAGMTYAGGKIGLSHFEIGSESETGFGPKLFGGHRFSSGWMLEAGYSFQTSDDIFGADDTYDLERYDLMLGYQFAHGDVLRIIPKVGRGRWTLTQKDGALIDLSDDQQPSVEIGDGTDDIAELIFEFHLSELLQLDVSYEKFQYRFGESKVSAVGLRFEF